MSYALEWHYSVAQLRKSLSEAWTIQEWEEIGNGQLIHRREIDGIRAVAVVPVVLFHAGLPSFSGGFVGVDVFFVISGFLITSIILDDLSEKRFSLLEFYERRARRILPALIVVVSASIPIAWLVMLPDPLENFGQSVVATMLSLNNVLLALTSGYWELASEFKPLMHTWSLGVEEQFYVLFPIIMLAAYPKLQTKTVVVVWVIVFASFAAALVLTPRFPSGSFYLLHTRAWELGLGALAAFWNRSRLIPSSDALGVLGLLLIGFSVFTFDQKTVHPSFLTLIPTLGTVLILLFAKDGNRTSRALGFSPFVTIGLISYSLYLWHYVLLAFGRIVSFEEPSTAFVISLITAAVLLSFLTWKFIEQPFRDRERVTRSQVVVFCTLAIVGLSLAGLSLHLGKGFPGRVFESSGEEAAGMHISYNQRISAYDKREFDDYAGPNVLVVGNSHGRDFANILLETGQLTGQNLVYKYVSGACSRGDLSTEEQSIFDSADVIFFVVTLVREHCIEASLVEHQTQKHVFFVGPKHFGYNLNAFLRIPREERPTAMSKIIDPIARANDRNRIIATKDRYIDLISYASSDGRHIRVFDNNGAILSADRVHVTQAGARFFAEQIRDHPSITILRKDDQ